jgi:hypothetical protein
MRGGEGRGGEGRGKERKEKERKKRKPPVMGLSHIYLAVTKELGSSPGKYINMPQCTCAHHS